MIRKITDGFTPKHYLVEFLFGLTALWGFYLIIAWSSYSPFDTTWSVSSYQTEVINKAGWLGAWTVDLFFVLFGYVGHLLPFLLLIAPIYFIRTKRVDSLTWTRFGLRMFGFSMLMIGLTTLSALLLENTNTYLSGGVLGASLAKALAPVLGKFGLLILGLIGAVVGFVFCSGASLIRLLVRFYNWLTVKNEEDEITEQRADGADNEAQLSENAENESDEFAYEENPQNLAQASDFSAEDLAEPSPIKIIGLDGVNEPNAEQFEAQSEAEYASHNSEFNQAEVPFSPLEIEQPVLPVVKIADEYSAENEKYADENDTLTPWQQAKPVEPLDPFAPKTLEPELAKPAFMSPNQPEQNAMPEVRLTPNSGFNAPFVADEIADSDDLNELSATLAAQFSQQEADRERQRLQQAEQLGVNTNPYEPPKVALAQADYDDENEEDEAAEAAQNGLRTIPVDKLADLFGEHKSKEKPTTELPTLELLDKRVVQSQNITEEQIRETSKRIEHQLQNFKIKALVKDVLIGPVVTRYELELQPGVKASSVSRIDTDLARALTFKAIRVTETIPGKPYIGIETPNKERQIVPLRDVLDSEEFRQSKARLPMALGKDISGTPIVIDLAKTPHLLVAGSTGSGKSVGINTMILSLLFRVKPEEVKFIMIDPKVVELSIYNDIPHLLTEVVTDMKKAANALRWCVDEMERRYQLLSQLRVRNIEGFNERIENYRNDGIGIPDPLWKQGDTLDKTAPHLGQMSYIVVIVDEFADLMMQVGKQIEELIARLTQKARAVGIHVILATQRPSVDVITGLIKSNIPSRIAFTVVQRNDSRTILDQNGAEALLGMGDMLYLGNGTTDLVRVHGAYMSDDEVARVADDWRARGKPNYISSILESADDNDLDDGDDFGGSTEDLDPLFDKAVDIVVNTGSTSTSFIQRRLKIGFNRAANIMDQLEEQGIVSEMRNGKRELLSRSPDF
ncbi:cell division protein FtsK [Pasteurellaceae bacterium Pebbles2]|nr:cell division protein FtsK [Pasteurellaceae bacterium Pebbles2]